MVAENEGVALLSLAAKKGLIAQDSAVGIQRQIESGVHGPVAGAKPIAELLVKEGHITATQADLLLVELAKVNGPKVIGGHQLVAKLGQGGMGTVFKAIQLSMQREVALKVLTPALARDKEFTERFIREARAAGKVIHPNVISCFDVGMDHGVAYMSLELVSGGDALKRAQAAGGKLQEREALEIIRDCAHGLAAIAKAGLIHRDIKPANIFLTEDGHAKLADLGLARSSSGDDRMTQTGAAVGSPAYMAPEQAKGIHDLDIRADIYALGATLYHLLCGQPPFTGSSVFATVNKVINEPTPDPRVLTPAITTATVGIIRTMMAKDREQRFQTPEALAAAVEAVLAGKAPTALHPAAHAHHAHHGPARATKPMAAKRPTAALYAIGGLATVGVLAGVAVLVGGRSPTPARSEPVVAVAPVPVSSAPAAVVAPAPVARPTLVVAAPDPAPSPATARGALRTLVELAADRREKRREEERAAAEAVIAEMSASPLSAPPVASPDASVAAPVVPVWATEGVTTLDLALAGDLTAAAAAAKALPTEFQEAITALQAARKELPKVYVAQQAAIVAAKPKLPSMPNLPEMALTAISDKGIRFADPAGAATPRTYEQLSAADHAALRATLVNAPLTPEQRRVIARLDLSAANLLAADDADPAVAALQRLAQVKADLAAEAKRAANAERKRNAVLGSVVLDWKALDPRTQRTLTNLAAVTTFEPTVVQGVIDRPIQLRDFVLIRPDATIGEGGRLIPCAGAVVLNASPKAFYEAAPLRGVPFISCSLYPTQSHVPRGFERGRTFTNCVFYGNVLLDGLHSPRFEDCAFIGAGDPAVRESVVWNALMQREGQIENCDFYRLRLRCGLPLAASDQCAFTACEVAFPAPGSVTPASIAAWDAQGALQAQLTAIGAHVRLRPLDGRPQTPFGNDVAALAQALDQVVATWVPRLRL